MKKFLVVIVIIIILGIIYLYYNYQQTTFIYKNNIPQGFFDDIGRIVVQNDQYEVFKDFMSGTYSNFSDSIETPEFSRISKGFDQAIDSGDKEYFTTNKQVIIDLEKAYQENKIFESLNKILFTGTRGHLNSDTNITEILNDTARKSNTIIKQMSWMMILRCSLQPEQKLCNQYQLIIKEIIKRSDRRSGLIQGLINLINIKYIIKQEKISGINFNLCYGKTNRKEKYKTDIIDEYNITFKILIKGVTEPLKEGLEKIDIKGLNISSSLLLNFNKTKLPEEIYIQSIKKGQEGFYNLIIGKDNKDKENLGNTIQITKSILAKIGVRSNYYIGDMVSDVLFTSLIPKLNTISTRYKKLGELCKENPTF